MQMMFRYEIKKVFSKKSSKIAILLLLIVVIITCWFATDVFFVNENGEKKTGYAAVRQLRKAQKEWAGVLDEEKLRQVIEENNRINATPEANSKKLTDQEIAYGWTQGIYELRNLLNCSYGEDFCSYDYYRADDLSTEDAGAFYENRIMLLKNWLSDDGKYLFSDAEKKYLIKQYESLETPFGYDYMKGWTQVLEYAPTIIMVGMLILGFLVAGIFSSEFSWKSDAIFFSTVYGRNKAVAAKIKAGLSIVTVIYWAAILLYSTIVLVYLGIDGAACPIQADFSGWKCFYNIQIWQVYLLTVVGGYVGCLFISLLTMFISAKTKSAVLAVMLPFVLIFLPSFLGNIESPVINKILGLLPDRLLQVSTALTYFDLYKLGNKVMGAIPILFVLYGILAIFLLPILYHEYRCKQIN